MHKKLLCILILSLASIGLSSAQQYSLFEAKKMKEGRATLTSKPHLWFGKANKRDKTVTVSESESLEYGQKKACQYAAIKALKELQDKAKKKKYVIVKNIYSPKAKPGFYYCDVGWRSATVKLTGTFTNK